MKFSYDLVLAYVSVLPSKAEAKDSDDDLLRRNDTFSTIVEHECFFKCPRVAMFQHLRLRCSCEAVGTYVCFVLRSIGIRFADKDECAFNNGDCEHVCVNSYLSHSCHCRGGYTIASDNRNCYGNF